MTRRRLLAVGAFVAAAGIVPLLLDDFLVSLALSCLMYVALATSWAMFSGATRYVSLATAAFFGIGAYTVAVLHETLPWIAVLAAAGAIGVVLSKTSSMRIFGAWRRMARR